MNSKQLKAEAKFANSQQTVSVCASCPWLKQNHGQPHPAGWYKLSNLKRLWNGLRTGKAPGMVCHSTDPESADYGSTKKVPETVKPRECAGAIILCIRQCNEAGKDIAAYKQRHQYPMNKAGFATWVGRSFDFFNPLPKVAENEDVQLPWDIK